MTIFSTIRGAARGLISASGLTVPTGKLLGRTTAGTGAIEEITPDTASFTLTGGALALKAAGASVNQGGTGASTPANARKNLGTGTAGRALVPPASSGMTALNIGTAIFTDQSYGVSVRAPRTSNDQIQGYYTTPPATPYRTILNLQTVLNLNTGGAQSCGLFFRESGSGKIITFGPNWRYSANAYYIAGIKWNSATSYNSDIGLYVVGNYFSNIWISVRDDGTTLYFDISSDGDSWANYGSLLRSNFLTPNQVGFYVNPVSANGLSDTTVTFKSFESV